MEWHPANGGAIRRLTLSRRVVRGLIVSLAVVSAAVAAGGLSAGLERLGTHDEIVAARHESESLHARQTALRRLSLELVEPVEPIGGALLPQRGDRRAAER